MMKVLNIPDNLTTLVDIYLKLKKQVIEMGFGWEIDWQNNIRIFQVTESDFLREAAWVVLSSGMRESVIRQKFPSVSRAFFQWESAEKISKNQDVCEKDALSVFRHKKKIDAIIQICAHVFRTGYETVRREIEDLGVDYIIQFPYMGPATSFHFAKNIGLPVAKPDRHLSLIAKTVGYSSAQSMCEDISSVTGEKVSVVDVVLWRFASCERNYLSYFCDSTYRRK